MKTVQLILCGATLCCAFVGSAYGQSNTTESYRTTPNSITPKSDNSSSDWDFSSQFFQPSLAPDAPYGKKLSSEKTILPYQPLREADVFWEKYIWREIDTRQKMNQPFVYAKLPFIGVVFNILKNHPNAPIYADDEFKTPITLAEVSSRLGAGKDSTFVVDPDTGEGQWKVVFNDFDWTSITKYRLKETWVFDQNTSRMVVRILGIAPIRQIEDRDGNYRGETALFWLYYPKFREYFIKYDTFNPLNDSNSLSWDDIFEMRFFSSRITKESNNQDRRIQDYSTGRDALLESERVKQELFEKDESLWQR
ncbi:MAG TPA: gliding motility protein GldN [Chitinophagales bacterium]|nr:gliding motility protein GldN [Chitinophagales bacterium]